MKKYSGITIEIEVGEASVDNETWDIFYDNALLTLGKAFPGATIRLDRAEAWNGDGIAIKMDDGSETTMELERDIFNEYEWIKDSLWN